MFEGMRQSNPPSGCGVFLMHSDVIFATVQGSLRGVRSKAHRRSKRLARGSFGMALQDGAMTKRGCQAKKTAIGATIAATGGKTSPLLKCWAIVAKPRSTWPGTDITMTATDTLKHHIKTG